MILGPDTILTDLLEMKKKKRVSIRYVQSSSCRKKDIIGWNLKVMPIIVNANKVYIVKNVLINKSVTYHIIHQLNDVLWINDYHVSHYLSRVTLEHKFYISMVTV